VKREKWQANSCQFNSLNNNNNNLVNHQKTSYSSFYSSVIITFSSTLNSSNLPHSAYATSSRPVIHPSHHKSSAISSLTSLHFRVNSSRHSNNNNSTYSSVRPLSVLFSRSFLIILCRWCTSPDTATLSERPPARAPLQRISTNHSRRSPRPNQPECPPLRRIRSGARCTSPPVYPGLVHSGSDLRSPLTNIGFQAHRSRLSPPRTSTTVYQTT
jgi:hypothetical protein